MGLNARTGLAILGAGFLPGFLFGCNSAFWGFILEILDEVLEIDEGGYRSFRNLQNKYLVLSLIYGFAEIFGGFGSGVIADRLGRKKGLLCSAILGLLSIAFCGCSKIWRSLDFLIAARCIAGLTSGLNIGLAPMYLIEISPVQNKGAFGTVYVLGTMFAVLIAKPVVTVLVNVSSFLTGFLALTLFPNILQIVILPFCPESFKYLILNLGREKEAQTALEWFCDSKSEVEKEMEDLKAESEAIKRAAPLKFTDMFSNALLRTPLFLSMFLLVSQQLCGIGLTYFYSQQIFYLAGFPKFASVHVLPTVSICSGLISVMLVDRVGRRPLILFSFIGMLACNIVLFFILNSYSSLAWMSFLAVFTAVAFVAVYGIGVGSISWYFVAEVSSQSGRGLTTSLAVGINSISSLIVGIFMIPLVQVLGAKVFLFCTVLLAIFAGIVYFYLPETKNKTTREINDTFKLQSY